MPRKIIFIGVFLFFMNTSYGWVANSSAKEAHQSPSNSIETVSTPKASTLKIAQAFSMRRDKVSASKPRSGLSFVLGPRDLIEISVWGNDKLTVEMPVRPDGFISFPLIGDIPAAGLTPDELRKKIAVNLEEFLTDPNVSVIIKEINSDTIRISVGGEVKKPGSYQVHKPVTLLHGISIAEGFTERADLKKSFLLRRGKKVKVDIFALIEESDLPQNVFLQNNDLIYFPDNFGNRINIIGEVNKPQVITFQEGMTVLDAVLLAEGLTETAKPTATKIYRKIIRSPDRKVIKKLQVDLGKVIFEGDLSKNVQLKPGDIILIPRSFF